jgi:hypothetical protein
MRGRATTRLTVKTPGGLTDVIPLIAPIDHSAEHDDVVDACCANHIRE